MERALVIEMRQQQQQQQKILRQRKSKFNSGQPSAQTYTHWVHYSIAGRGQRVIFSLCSDCDGKQLTDGRKLHAHIYTLAYARTEREMNETTNIYTHNIDAIQCGNLLLYFSPNSIHSSKP